MNSLPLSFLAFNFNYNCLGSWVGELKEFCFNLILGSLCFVYWNLISVSVTCFSSTFLAIYNSLAIVLVGSRKALRSRLGFLVSGSWDLNSHFNSLFNAFIVHLLCCYKIRFNPNSLFLFCLMQFSFPLFKFCKSSSQSPLLFKQFTFLAL